VGRVAELGSGRSTRVVKNLLIIGLFLCHVAVVAEVSYPTNQTVQTAQYGVLLHGQSAYLGVLVTQSRHLSVSHYALDFKPQGDLTTKMVRVDLETRDAKRRLRLKNRAGFLSSEEVLPGTGPWTLSITVQRSRDVAGQSYRIEYRPEWISKRW
jgi:hypothetical protein